jgi:hypothetical protein
MQKKLLSGLVDIDQLNEYLHQKTGLEVELLKKWYLNSRQQQNILRSVRYWADYFTFNSYSYSQVLEQLYSILPNVPRDLIQKEIDIYYQYTGLGDVYISGAAKMLEMYKEDKLGLFTDLQTGSNSWREFLAKKTNYENY